MRTVKKHDDRLKEILDVSEELFYVKGYDVTTINDILVKVNIAKGTFYHYFKSKEDVLDAIIMRLFESKIDVMEMIVTDKEMNAIDKIAAILFSIRPQKQEDRDNINSMHASSNALFHQKVIQKMVLELSPFFTKVFKQGCEEQLFSNPYLQETSELLLMSQFILDDGLFTWKGDQQIRRINAFIYSMEVLLGAKSGTFSFINDLFEHHEIEESFNEQ